MVAPLVPAIPGSELHAEWIGKTVEARAPRIRVFLRQLWGSAHSSGRTGLSSLGLDSSPNRNEIRRLLHALREPVSAFAIHVALIDDRDLNEDARSSLDAMLTQVEHMTKALAAITKAFGLELDDSTPLAMLSRTRERPRLLG